MKPTLRRTLIVVNPDKDDAASVLEEVRSFLSLRSVESEVVSHSGEGEVFPPGDFDLLFSLGGDGTVLFSARLAAPRGIPIFPINLGRLGFIAEIGRGEWESCLECYLAGTIKPTERLMLAIEVLRGRETIAKEIALNDAVVSASGIAKIITLKVELSGVPLGGYRADGVIVSTPTGSTAYSLAAGGPILNPTLEAMLINPICAFSLSNRPLVVPDTELIEIKVDRRQRSAVNLTVDGQVLVALEPEDIVRISASPFRARILPAGKLLFYDVLRAKLNWSGGHDA
jgi:NAD+ kinase